jgi:hypothetical protein
MNENKNLDLGAFYLDCARILILFYKKHKAMAAIERSIFWKLDS